MTLTKKLAIVLHGAIFLLLFVWLVLPASQGNDFYPYWFSAQALLEGKDPYSPEVVQEMRNSWTSGNPSTTFTLYPIPLLIALSPFGLLPLPIALLLWRIVLFLSVGTLCWASWKRAKSPLVPLVFYPIFRGVELHQATLPLTAITALTLYHKNLTPIFRGACLFLLPQKPQVGSLFFIYGVIKSSRPALFWFLVFFILIAVVPTISMPWWITEWLTSIRMLSSVLITYPGAFEYLLPEGSLLLGTSIIISWKAALAALQVLLFPVTDTYFFIPLTIIWIEIGGVLAYLGAGTSWLAVMLYDYPSHPRAWWLTVIFPLTVASLLKSFFRRKDSN